MEYHKTERWCGSSKIDPMINPRKDLIGKNKHFEWSNLDRLKAIEEEKQES